MSLEPIARTKDPLKKRPVFPERTVDIRDHGAVGNGQTLNTKAIAKANTA